MHIWENIDAQERLNKIKNEKADHGNGHKNVEKQYPDKYRTGHKTGSLAAFDQ
jgi:hypothetical protein